VSSDQAGSFGHSIILFPLSIGDIGQTIGLSKVDVLWHSFSNTVVK
jgi:hypothetical protein